MKWNSSKEGVIILKKILVFWFIAIYIVGVLSLIYVLNKQNEYVPPSYLQNSIYDTNNEIKLNGIGYKVKNIEITKVNVSDRNLNEWNRKKLIINIRVSNYNEKEYILDAKQFNVSNDIENIFPKIQPTNLSNEINNNYLKLTSIGIVKENNVRDFKLVFKLDEETANVKRLFFNINSKMNSNNTISFDLSNNKEEI